jgi:hypothetical protein
MIEMLLLMPEMLLLMPEMLLLMPEMHGLSNKILMGIVEI